MNGETRKQDLPNASLAAIPKRMEHGLDMRRLNALADFIEPLEMMPPWYLNKNLGGPVGPIRYGNRLNGHPILGYKLHDGGGYGKVIYDEAQDGKAALGLYLTGYGLTCWAWGPDGLANVVENGHVRALEDVFTAAPIHAGRLGGVKGADVACRHVAEAIRAFTVTQDPMECWSRAFDRVGWVRPEPPRPKEAPPAPDPAPEPPPREEWQGLLLAEDYDGLAKLAQGEVDRLRDQRDRLDEAIAQWEKRLRMANAARGVS